MDAVSPLLRGSSFSVREITQPKPNFSFKLKVGLEPRFAWKVWSKLKPISDSKLKYGLG